jgi:ATP-dependent protease ClpP protease subunit
MSHQYAWGNDGKHHELLATIREFELTQKRMVNHYVTCTGLSQKKTSNNTCCHRMMFI